MSKPPYRKWWLGKYLEDGRKITDVRWIGGNSMVYGDVILTTEDGKHPMVPNGVDAYKPRKKDLVVFDEFPPIKPCALFTRRKKCSCYSECPYSLPENGCELAQEKNEGK